MKRIAIFGSGSGSNAQKIIEYFKASKIAEVALIVSNNSLAGILERAKKLKIPSHVFSESEFNQALPVIQLLKQENIDLVVLAGFLWLIPPALIQAFPDSIINIHPALLPKFSGKGMYGDHVHQAVLQAGQTCSGISIHYVDEEYDTGKIIYQEAYQIDPSDTLELVKKKCQCLEHKHYPRIIEQILSNLK